jgi:uncharacterized protein (TIGR04255 family)
VAQAKLPAKLRDVPIIDAVFEVRFSANLPMSSLLPGLLFGQLEGNKEISKLPAGEIPEPMRSMDPNLQYAPYISLSWGRFRVNIGDRSFSVSCLLPYPGWTEFKKAIEKINILVGHTDLLVRIERMSLKYTNVIPTSVGTAAEIADFDLRLGPKEAKNGLFHIRAEIQDGDIVHVVQLAPRGAATLGDGSMVEGTVFDIDSVQANSAAEAPTQFFSHLAERVEALHLKTKTMFFSLLKPNTIEKLGATYD